MARKWRQIDIVDLLQKNDRAVCRGVVAIYNRQTNSEKQDGNTHEHNGIGFNSADAGILSSFARQILRNSGRPKCPLSEKQVAVARHKMLKYARQLTDIANEGV